MSDKPENLPVDQILLNDGLQGRVRLDPSIVDEYADSMKFDNIEFPPIDVYFSQDTNMWYLLDGFHRIEACKKNGKTHITANVVPITNEDDAVWWAAAANQSHGLRRSNADKLRALELVLSLDSSLELSDREIARRIGVSHTFVSVNRSKDRLERKVKEAESGESLPPVVSDTASPSEGGGLDVDTKDLKAKMREISVVYSLWLNIFLNALMPLAKLQRVHTVGLLILTQSNLISGLLSTQLSKPSHTRFALTAKAKVATLVEELAG